MKTLLSRLKKSFPWIGERMATEDDFFEFCLREKIEVVFSNEISYGFYVVFGGDHFIFLNSRLHGLMLRYVMFHELGHHLFHVPNKASYSAEGFSLGCERKKHFEAEAVAALLLLPTLELHTALQSRDVYVSDELKELIATRLDLWHKYKI